MGKFAFGNALAVATLLGCFPASAEEPKFSTRDLLSANTGTSFGAKILGSACNHNPYFSPMALAGTFVEHFATEGRPAIVKVIARAITEGAVTSLCPEPAKPEPDPRKSMNLTMAGPRVITFPDPPIAGLKAPGQELCPLGQSYSADSLVCVGLERTPNCPPNQFFNSQKCVDIPSLRR